MKTCSGLSAIGLAAAMLTCAGAPADAASIRISWTGAIESLTTFGDPGAPTLDPRFGIGDAVSGVVRFGNAVFGSFTDQLPELRVYFGAPFSIRFTIGGDMWRAAASDIRGANDYDQGSIVNPLVDGITFNAEPTVNGPTVGGLAPTRLQLGLASFDTGILSDLSLPTVAQINALGATQSFDGNVNFLSFSNGETVRYTISSLSATIVPLPPAAVLLVGGLAMLGLVRRRRA